MKKVICKFAARFVMPITAFSCIFACGETSAQSYWTAQLEITGEQCSMSGSHSTSRGNWARFDMAFGKHQVKIETGKEKPYALPVAAVDEWDDGLIHLTASVAVRLIERRPEGYAVEMILQTGVAPGLGRRDLSSINGWTFDREDDEPIVLFDDGYTFVVEDPLLGGGYKMKLTIVETGTSGDVAESRHSDFRETLPEVELEVRYRLNDVTNRAGREVIKASRKKYFEPGETGGWAAEFAEVVYLEENDSCYHFITITLDELYLTQGSRRLTGKLKIDRETVFGSDSPIDAQRYSADYIFLDDFEKRVRFRNGKPVEIRIPTAENSRFPFPAIELFKITARW